MVHVYRRQLLHLGMAIVGVGAVSAVVGGRRFLELAVSRAKDATGPADRVAAARARLGSRLQDACATAGVAWPPGEVFVRAFKTGAAIPRDLNLEYVGFCAVFVQMELGLYVFEVLP